MTISKQITRITSTPKLMFLVDALGAMVSFMSLMLLAMLEPLFGIPAQVLYLLATIAIGLFAYSFCCHRFIKINWKPFLRIVMVLNTSYLVVSFSLVLRHFGLIKPLGFAYLILELFVVVWIISLEYRTLKNQH